MEDTSAQGVEWNAEETAANNSIAAGRNDFATASYYKSTNLHGELLSS